MTGSLFSTDEELVHLTKLLRGYLRLPFADRLLPGRFVETVVARIKGGVVLPTYDFADVIKPEARLGWQVKSTKDSTPVTWKRAKIPNAQKLIDASRNSADGLQALGDSIIEFCNAHGRASLQSYGLDRVGYCRVLLKPSSVVYFERELISRDSPDLFDPTEFSWSWSTAKKTLKKEQLPALHGHNRRTGRKWFAAHILGENQLHFSGESAWWPAPSDGVPQATFRYAAEHELIDYDGLVGWLDSVVPGAAT